MKRLTGLAIALALGLCGLPKAGHTQSATVSASPPVYSTGSHALSMNQSGGLRVDTTSSAVTLTTTMTSGTVTTANTFQSVSGSGAGLTRKGCTLQNTSSGLLYVYLGPTANATEASSFQVPAGGTFSCSLVSGGVAGDNVAITSATQGATWVLGSQR